MRIQPPKLAYYACTFEEATHAVCNLGLRHCEPLPEPLSIYHFANPSDLMLFKLRFPREIVVQEDAALVLPRKRAEADQLVQQLSMGSRVTRIDLLGVYLWDTEDEFAFNEEVGQPIYS
jgi:hypothetical protein